MKKFIIISLLFLGGCITIKPECPCKTIPEEKIDWSKFGKTVEKKQPIDSIATLQYKDIIWQNTDTMGLIIGNNNFNKDVGQQRYLNDTIILNSLLYNGGDIVNDTSFYLNYVFKDTIKPEPIWDFNVVDTSFETIDDSIVIYQFRYRVIPVTKEIQL